MKQMLKELATVVLLGGFGGFIRTLVGKKRNEPYNFRIGFTEILIAIFAGLLMHWLCSEYVHSDNLRTAAIALAGYSSRGIMALLDAAVISKCKKLAAFFGKLDLLLLTAIALLLLAGCEIKHEVYQETGDVQLVEIG